jgi:hypothetical protein
VHPRGDHGGTVVGEPDPEGLLEVARKAQAPVPADLVQARGRQEWFPAGRGNRELECQLIQESSQSDNPMRKPPAAKTGTATAGLHRMDHPPPPAPRPRDTSAPSPPAMKARNKGLRSFFIPLLKGFLLGLLRFFRPTGPACRGHSSGHTQARQDHRLKQDPYGQDDQQPNNAHGNSSQAQYSADPPACPPRRWKTWYNGPRRK